MSSPALARSHSCRPFWRGFSAFITALRSPALLMLPMLLTTSGGIVSAYWRGTPAFAVSLRLNRSSSSTCLASA